MSANSRRWVARVALLLLAAAVRLTALTDYPATAWVDETWFEWRARQVLAGVDVLPVPDRVFTIGNSPFQIYATAALHGLGLPALYASRYVSAFLGLVSVAAVTVLIRALLRGWPGRQWVSVLAAGLWALAVPALISSRDGTQNMGAVVFTVLALWAWLRLHHTGRTRWAALTGAFTAVALLTYEAAYALPLMLAALGGVTWWLAAPPQRPAWVRHGVVLAGVAGALFAPWAVYYLLHPEVVLGRLAATQTGDAWTALAGYGRVWLGVFWPTAGDPLPGQNVAGRPALEPVVAMLAALGLWQAGRHWRAPWAQVLLVWLVVGAWPSAVTANPPAFTRLLPWLPAWYGLVALGVMVLTRPPRPRWVWGLVVAGLGLSAASALLTYATQWTSDPRFFDARQVGVRRAGEVALREPGAVWLSPRTHPFVFYAYDLMFTDTPVTPVDADPTCWPLADRRPTPTTYGVLLPFGSAAWWQAARTAYPQGQAVHTVMHPGGYAYAVFWRVPAHTPAPALPLAPAVRLAEALELAGAAVPATVRAGDTLTVTLDWRALAPLTSAPTVFLHIGRDNDPLLAQNDAPLCAPIPMPTWQAGYVYRTQQAVAVPATAAPGNFDLWAGVYDPATGARWPITAAAVPAQDDRARLLTLTVLP